MGTLFKMVLLAVPVLALVFFYVVTQQRKHETQMEYDQAKMEREWNEWQADFEKNPEAKVRYQARAEEAGQEVTRLAGEKAAKEAKSRAAEAEMDAALAEWEEEHQQKRKEIKQKGR